MVEVIGGGRDDEEVRRACGDLQVVVCRGRLRDVTQATIRFLQLGSEGRRANRTRERRQHGSRAGGEGVLHAGTRAGDGGDRRAATIDRHEARPIGAVVVRVADHHRQSSGVQAQRRLEAGRHEARAGADGRSPDDRPRARVVSPDSNEGASRHREDAHGHRGCTSVAVNGRRHHRPKNRSAALNAIFRPRRFVAVRGDCQLSAVIREGRPRDGTARQSDGGSNGRGRVRELPNHQLAAAPVDDRERRGRDGHRHAVASRELDGTRDAAARRIPHARRGGHPSRIDAAVQFPGDDVAASRERDRGMTAKRRADDNAIGVEHETGSRDAAGDQGLIDLKPIVTPDDQEVRTVAGHDRARGIAVDERARAKGKEWILRPQPSHHDERRQEVHGVMVARSPSAVKSPRLAPALPAERFVHSAKGNFASRVPSG